MSPRNQRLATVVVAASVLFVASGSEFASNASDETDPDDVVRVIVPCPVGSPADILARTLARTLSEGLARKVRVENRPSGAGMGERAPVDRNAIFLVSPDADSASACGE